MRPVYLLGLALAAAALAPPLAAPAAAQSLTLTYPPSVAQGDTFRVEIDARSTANARLSTAVVVANVHRDGRLVVLPETVTGLAMQVVAAGPTGVGRGAVNWFRSDGALVAKGFEVRITQPRAPTRPPTPPVTPPPVTTPRDTAPPSLPQPPPPRPSEPAPGTWVPVPPQPNVIGAAAVPELPRVFLSADLPPVTGRTLVVAAGGSLQAAVDSAVLGDEIVVEAGATFTGTLRLPAKTTGSGWITIRSSALAQLPAGARVTPRDSVHMPRLLARRPTENVIETETAAHHYHLAGLYVTTEPLTKRTLGYSLVSLGIPSGLTASREKLPRDLALDRILVLPADSIDLQRCVALNSASTAIVDSWIAECHGKGKDSQAIGGWSGTGPYKIVNNYLAGAGENVMFGGADPRIKDRDSTGAIIGGTLPEDIEIRRNHFHKPASWQGVWTVKNLLELKLGRWVLIEGNVFEGNWSDAQTGFAVIMKSTNQTAAPWSETSNVTFRYNVLRDVAAGITVNGAPEKPAVRANRILIEHNLWEVGTGSYTGNGRLFYVANAPDVTVRQNTAVTEGIAIVTGAGCCIDRLTITGNVIRSGQYGLTGSSVMTFPRYAPAGVIADNIIATSQATRTLPTGNTYPGALPLPVTLETLLVQVSSAGSARSSGTPLVGAELAAVRAATAGVVVQP